MPIIIFYFIFSKIKKYLEFKKYLLKETIIIMATLSFNSYSCKQPDLDIDVVKLDLDSLKDDSSTYLSGGLEQRSIKSATLFNRQTKPKIYDKTLFTFKPKLNPKSNLIAQKFLNFYERQNIHTQKQLEIVRKTFFLAICASKNIYRF